MEKRHLIKYHPDKDIAKGKFILDRDEARIHVMTEHRNTPTKKWTTPPIGWCKLNIDGSFSDGNAGAGIIGRDHDGAIIFSSCR
jgi:hypothetical protein